MNDLHNLRRSWCPKIRRPNRNPALEVIVSTAYQLSAVQLISEQQVKSESPSHQGKYKQVQQFWYMV